MKTLNLLLLSIILFINCSTVNKENENSQNASKPIEFTGKLMVSSDQGATWSNLDEYMPKDLNIISVYADEDVLSLGSENGLIQNIDLASPTMATTENVMAAVFNKTPVQQNWVSEIFPLSSGHYTHVYGEGLFRKKAGSKFWEPLNIPEGINGVSKKRCCRSVSLS